LLSNCVLRVLSLVVFVGEVLFPYLWVSYFMWRT
jgi:hypothetical protein